MAEYPAFNDNEIDLWRKVAANLREREVNMGMTPSDATRLADPKYLTILKRCVESSAAMA